MKNDNETAPKLHSVTFLSPSVGAITQNLEYNIKASCAWQAATAAFTL